MSEPRVSESVRLLVAERASGCCENCLSQEKYSPDSFAVEHILPRTHGGSNESANLAFACQGCNNRKYIDTEAIDPVSGELVALSHPRTQRWQDHFIWNDDQALMVGITLTGRATIIKLQLNRTGVVNLRRILRMQQKHPPPVIKSV